MAHPPTVALLHIEDEAPQVQSACIESIFTPFSADTDRGYRKLILHPITDGYPADIQQWVLEENIKAVVVPGSRSHLADMLPWQVGLLDFIRRLFVLDPMPPFLGICFGHQAVALAFGGELSYGKVPTHGIRNIHFDFSNPVFGSIRFITKPLRMCVAHYDRVEVMPEGFTKIAVADYYPNHGIGHPLKPLFTFQAHPEFTYEILKLDENPALDEHTPEELDTPDGKDLLRSFKEFVDGYWE